MIIVNKKVNMVILKHARPDFQVSIQPTINVSLQNYLEMFGDIARSIQLKVQCFPDLFFSSVLWDRTTSLTLH